jgi:hypothetical protein
MSLARLFIPLFILTAIMTGCGGSGKGSNLNKGDIVITQEDLRETAETQWANSYTDGFTTVLPKGTKLKVLYKPAPAAQVFECIPVEINGKTDPAAVEAEVVPEHIRNKEGYESYVFALKKAYIGTEIKKVQ